MDQQQSQLFEDAVQLKTDSEFYKPRMNALQNLAKARFGKVANEFGNVRNMEYFNGGVPDSDSPSKKLKFIEKIGSVLSLWRMLGHDTEIVPMMEEKFGISIDYSNFKEVDERGVADDKKFAKLMKSYYPDESDLTDDPEKLLQRLLKDSLVSIKEVKQAEFDIEELAEKAEAMDFCTKGDFKKAVAIEVSQRDGKDIKQKIEKLEHTIDSLENIRQIFD